MKTSRGRVRWLGAAVLTGLLGTAPAARAQVVHTENFETGGLGAYTEVPGSTAPSLWHGDAVCGDLPGPPIVICLDNDTSAVQAMPFPFAFFGSATTQFRANTNGFVIMNGTGSTEDPTGGSASNTLLPDAAPPNNIVCPWWDDQILTVGGVSRISTLLTGAPGSQVLTVQWTSTSTVSGLTCPFNDGSSLSYQVQFHEATGVIELRYDNAGFVPGSSPRSASIGAEALLASGYVGVEPTGVGPGNDWFPVEDFLLMPSGETYIPSPTAPAWSSIVGLPGETILLEAVTGGPIPMPASFGTNAASYNRGDEIPPVYEYSTGGPNSGAIESPVFAVPAGTFDVIVTYDSHREMEVGSSFDQSVVEARGGASPAWDVLFQQDTNRACTLGPTTITVSSAATQALAAGGGGQIRFRVDTGNGALNATDGWSVDNISVAVSSVPGLDRMAPPSPCAGSGGCTPVIGWSGEPPMVAAPDIHALTLTHALGGVPALLAIGASSGFPFPIDLGLIVGGGPCYLMNDAGMIVVGLTTTGSGPCEGTLSIPISLGGVQPGGPIFAQFFVIDPVSPLLGLPVVASDQLAVTVMP